MLTTDKQRQTCQKYSARDSNGKVHCNECPLRLPQVWVWGGLARRYVTTTDTRKHGYWMMTNIELTTENFATLAICAIRYCHGRQTYMPSLVQGIIRPHLTELSDRDLSVMLHDCESMTLFDYGNPTIDRPDWERWHEDLKKEKERRENATL